MIWFLGRRASNESAIAARAALAWRRPGVEPIATPALAVAPRE
ncbi:hypothetical protein ACNUIP_09975 [Pseudomonas aeruginosa]